MEMRGDRASINSGFSRKSLEDIESVSMVVLKTVSLMPIPARRDV
eukprot:CAMPEP_0115540014 /NCGR_PEP_ID=MMETSP0271-20121206/89706_1 /TAXON_ID=71861 /ORGANISM="Scrippsiella trochoidea, Strain CCMP3099" /LENGTH=44 /DNA_ID= /DNA_START= /DNA_END= /DNA_ORIENTATION=